MADMENREQAIEILAKPAYLDLPCEYLRPSLTGQLFHQRAQDQSEQIDFHVFNHLNAGFLGAQMLKLCCSNLPLCWVKN